MAAVLFIAGSSLGLALPSLAQKVGAAGCPPPPIMFGRYKWCGYFYSRFESNGGPVRAAGVPGGVNTAAAFLQLVNQDWSSGNAQKQTEAVFLVRTMIGDPLPTPPCAPGTCKTISAAQWNEFVARVNSYASTSENGSQSFGPNGHIDWYHSDYMHCGDFNSYYQPTENDIAPYVITKSNTPQCDNPGAVFDHIFIYNNAGAVIWRIRRLCMNPLGTIGPLSPAPASYNLTSSITVTSGGNPLISGSYVQAGDQVSFNYNVNNSTSGTATGVSCQAHANNSAGWQAVPSPAQTTGPNPPGVACTGTFGPGNTSLGTENIASAPNDTSLCRSLIVSPSTPTGGQSAVEVCVYVSSRPYMRVYGGDVSAGNPQPGACGTVTQAGIVGWSKDLTGYAGAATQYAALAINSIYDFSTSLGNGAGAAPAGSGLAFSNTGASGDTFGGNFGSLPCITDYYAASHGPNFAGGDMSAVPSGSYTATGPVTVHGSAAAGQQFVLYVNGDVTIDGPLRYTGLFTPGSVPLIKIVASGNIYIDKSVSDVAGLFVAQASGVPGSGTIYTCTNGSVPYSIDATGSFNGPCHNTLTINGAFVAKQVRFMRTNGTAKQANPGEASGTNQAEVFNYTPALWMGLSDVIPTGTAYDSITSLPPIL